MRNLMSTIAFLAAFILGTITPALADPPFQVPPGHQGGNQEQLQLQLQKQFQKQKASATNSGVSVDNSTDYDSAASSAFAGRGVSGDCMASSGVGAQTMGVGVSLGSNWFDEKCRTERRARALGNKTAAQALLCQDEDTREAYRVAADVEGDPSLACPQDRVAAKKADLKKATYWRDPKTGRVERVLKTAVTLPDGNRDVIAWRSPRVE